MVVDRLRTDLLNKLINARVELADYLLLRKAKGYMSVSESDRLRDNFFALNRELHEQSQLHGMHLDQEEVKEERWNRFMQLQQQISAERLQEKVGREILVIVDEVDEEGAIGRSMADAPEIDGAVYLNGETKVKPGDIIRVKVENADEYDLWGTRV